MVDLTEKLEGYFHRIQICTKLRTVGQTWKYSPGYKKTSSYQFVKIHGSAKFFLELLYEVSEVCKLQVDQFGSFIVMKLNANDALKLVLPNRTKKRPIFRISPISLHFKQTNSIALVTAERRDPIATIEEEDRGNNRIRRNRRRGRGLHSLSSLKGNSSHVTVW